MRVLIVNYEYAPQSGGGGFTARNLALGLVQHGVAVDMLIGWDFSLGDPPASSGLLNFICVPIRKKNVHYSGLWAVCCYLARGMRVIRSLTRAHRYDLIHYMFSVPSGFLQFFTHGRVPYLCSLMGIDVPFFNKNEFPVLQALALPFNYLILKSASAVVSLSQELQAHLHRWFPSIRSQVIPNGIDLSQSPSKKEYARRAQRFVCVSRLIRVKRIDVLLEAFAKVAVTTPEISLDIFGEGYLKESLQRKIDQLALQGRARLCGYLAPEKLRQQLCQYDAFVLPTEADSFGMVFIEAMGAGLPVIAACCGGPKDIVVHEQNGLFVEPGSVGELVVAMQRLIDEDFFGEKMGRRARHDVETNFSVDSVVDRYRAVYEQCLLSDQRYESKTI